MQGLLKSHQDVVAECYIGCVNADMIGLIAYTFDLLASLGDTVQMSIPAHCNQPKQRDTGNLHAGASHLQPCLLHHLLIAREM